MSEAVFSQSAKVNGRILKDIVKTFGFGQIFQHSVDDWNLSIFIIYTRFLYCIHVFLFKGGVIVLHACLTIWNRICSVPRSLDPIPHPGGCIIGTRLDKLSERYSERKRSSETAKPSWLGGSLFAGLMKHLLSQVWLTLVTLEPT